MLVGGEFNLTYSLTGGKKFSVRFFCHYIFYPGTISNYVQFDCDSSSYINNILITFPVPNRVLQAKYLPQGIVSYSSNGMDVFLYLYIFAIKKIPNAR